MGKYAVQDWCFEQGAVMFLRQQNYYVLSYLYFTLEDKKKIMISTCVETNHSSTVDFVFVIQRIIFSVQLTKLFHLLVRNSNRLWKGQYLWVLSGSVGKGTWNWMTMYVQWTLKCLQHWSLMSCSEVEGQLTPSDPGWEVMMKAVFRYLQPSARMVALNEY